LRPTRRSGDRVDRQRTILSPLALPREVGESKSDHAKLIIAEKSLRKGLAKVGRIRADKGLSQ